MTDQTATPAVPAQTLSERDSFIATVVAAIEAAPTAAEKQKVRDQLLADVLFRVTNLDTQLGGVFSMMTANPALINTVGRIAGMMAPKPKKEDGNGQAESG